MMTYYMFLVFYITIFSFQQSFGIFPIALSILYYTILIIFYTHLFCVTL